MSDAEGPLRVGLAPGFVDACLHEFGRAVSEMGLAVTPEDSVTVRAWLQFYSRWPGRRVIGFTGAKDVAVKLLADSYAVRLLGPGDVTGPAIDLGSGNGWPGLAFISSGRVTLLDSRQGACDFMRGFVESVRLPNVDVVEERAEDAGRTTRFAGSFGVVASRAMASPAVAVEVAAPFLKEGGAAVLWLGPAQEETVETHPEIPEAGLTLAGLKRYSLPDGTGRRALAVYRKTGMCLPGHPRKIASIRAKPLF